MVNEVVFRILWNSDCMIGPSAYSRITYETLTQLVKLGYPVAHVAMVNALRRGPFTYEGVLILPSGNDPWNEDVFLQHYCEYNANVLITLKEPWAFSVTPHYALNWIPITPIDHDPVSPLMLSKLQTCFKVIAISRFGQRELKRNQIESTYIPHAVNTDVFKPLEGKRGECRKLWYLDPDEFVVGIIAKNQVRKMLPHMLRGYRRFLDTNKDVKSHLFLWTLVGGGIPEAPHHGVSDLGVNLLPEMKLLDLWEKVKWADDKMILRGIPDWSGEDYVTGWDMVKLYGSMNVLLLASGGEGFSLPLIEAQACGVPVITTDYAAAPEQVGAGLTVKPSDYIIVGTPGQRYAVPSVDGIAEALTRIYNADREKLAKRARRFAERYSWPNVLDNYWKPFLSEVESDLKPKITKSGVKTW